jgi:hypothetical protein
MSIRGKAKAALVMTAAGLSVLGDRCAPATAGGTSVYFTDYFADRNWYVVAC